MRRYDPKLPFVGLFILSLLLTSCAENRSAEVEVGTDTSVTCGPISGYPFHGRSACYSIVEGIPLAEGDIVVEPRGAQNDTNREAVAITGATFRWPNGEVPIEITPEVSNPGLIYSAIEEYHRATPIRFRAKRDGDNDYISVIDITDPRLGGWSELGRRGGRQEFD